jgi:double-stranded uracil-DNA glycosylase
LRGPGGGCSCSIGVRSHSERQLDMSDAVEPEISKEDKWRSSRRRGSGKLSKSGSNEPGRQPTRYSSATSHRSLLRFESGRNRSSGRHSFSSPSNRFWQTIYLAGFTPRKLRPDQEKELLMYGCGLTAVVSRATRSASELSRQEYARAAPYLETKVLKYAPRILAFLGKTAYSSIAARTQIAWGSQGTTFGGAEVWVLPNPSGLNRTFTLAKLVEAYTALREAVTDRGYA